MTLLTIRKAFSYIRLFYSEITHMRIVNTDGGILWIILPQTIQVLIYFIIFSIGFRTSSISDAPFIIYMLPAFLIWSLFSDSLISCSSLLSQYQYMVSKFPLPYYLLVFSYYLYSLCVFLVLSAVFFAVASFFFSFTFSFASISLFLVTLLIFSFFTFSVSLLVSIFSFISKDVQNAVSILINSLFWLSPVVYPSSLLLDFPPAIKFLLFKLYPVNLLIDSVRIFSSTNLHPNINLLSVIPALIISLLAFIVSLTCYKRTRYFLAEFA